MVGGESEKWELEKCPDSHRFRNTTGACLTEQIVDVFGGTFDYIRQESCKLLGGEQKKSKTSTVCFTPE